MTTTSESLKDLRALAQRVAAASRDHSLLPELRRECQQSLAGIDPEKITRWSDYRAGQAEILLAVLTAIEERTQESANLFDDGRLRVYRNSLNEICVEDIRSGTELRISSWHRPEGGLLFTSNTDGTGIIEPFLIGDNIAWRMRRRR